MSKLLIEQQGSVTLFTLNHPAVHNNVDHELAMELADGGTQRLPRVVGLGNALYMIETGVEIDAHHALRIGLVQEVVPAGAALARALEVARHIASYPQNGTRVDRRAALATFGLSLEEGLDLEARALPSGGRHARGDDGWNNPGRLPRSECEPRIGSAHVGLLETQFPAHDIRP
jgi:enoyl-CoA hydratase/carnithine racemase